MSFTRLHGFGDIVEYYFFPSPEHINFLAKIVLIDEFTNFILNMNRLIN